MIKELEKLQQQYDSVVERYTDIFYQQIWEEEPHESDIYWIGGEIGGICNIGDYYLDFDRIKNTVDWEVKPDDFFEFYWKDLEGEMELNYKHFLKLEKGYDIEL